MKNGGKSTIDCMWVFVLVRCKLVSLQSFCCVDKKGILSWPNPTAEKVFFLTTESIDESHTSSHQSAESGHSTEQLDDECDDVFCVNKDVVAHQKQDKGNFRNRTRVTSETRHG